MQDFRNPRKLVPPTIMNPQYTKLQIEIHLWKTRGGRDWVFVYPTNNKTHFSTDPRVLTAN